MKMNIDFLIAQIAIISGKDSEEKAEGLFRLVLGVITAKIRVKEILGQDDFSIWNVGIPAIAGYVSGLQLESLLLSGVAPLADHSGGIGQKISPYR